MTTFLELNWTKLMVLVHAEVFRHICAENFEKCEFGILIYYLKLFFKWPWTTMHIWPKLQIKFLHEIWTRFSKYFFNIRYLYRSTSTYYIIVHLSKVNEYQTLFGFPIKTNKMKCSYCRFACTHYLKNKRTAACITKLYMNWDENRW